MNKLIYLIIGLYMMGCGIFGVHWTYKYLKKGKMRSAYIFDYNVYSFKKNPTKAYLMLAANCIVSLISLAAGIGFILMYFQILK